MNKILSAGFSACLAAVLALATPCAAQQPIVIKFSHVVARETPKGKGAEKFAELAAKYSGGRVKVEVYPNSQLYKDKEELEAIRLGAVQMLAPTVAKFGPLGVKEFEVFDVPFMFPDMAAAGRVMYGPIGAKLMGLLEDKGIHGLAYWENGFNIMSANQPLRTPDDLRGLKMRIQSSKVIEAQMRALGVIPQVLALSEVYPALATGVVDGTENVPSNMYTQRFFEVQKHVTLSFHGLIAYAVIVNKKFWDDLPADIRAQIERAMKETTQYVNAIAQQDNDEAIAEMRKKGTSTFHTLTPAERAKFIAAIKPVYPQVANRVGKDLLDAVLREVGAGMH